RTGATTKELMARLGHASPRAAMIYQHAADDRDRRIAEGLDAMAEDAGLRPPDPAGGHDEPARSSPAPPLMGEEHDACTVAAWLPAETCA
ncbi:MAG: hypothetical protein M3P85_07795, partial [Actinomycetota bacterium]|nr:hypothetical protein [Actinomycetota bacterium]